MACSRRSGSGDCAKKNRAIMIVCLLFSYRDTALNSIITIPRDVVSNRRKRADYRKRNALVSENHDTTQRAVKLTTGS